MGLAVALGEVSARDPGGPAGRSVGARPPSRRRFLLRALGALAAGIAAEVAGIAAVYLSPERSRGGRRVRCGRADSLARDEVRLLPDERVFVIRRGDGILALSQKCTHLACLVSWDESLGAFRCPCHGGTFDRDGLVTHGPPQRPLDVVGLSIVGGELIADTGAIVRRKGWSDADVVRG